MLKPLPRWADYIAFAEDTPNNEGPRAYTTGVVVHSTRGGQPYGQEWQATVNWFLNPASGASANLLIGRDGRVAQFGPLDWVTWHAREYNYRWLGVELEQPHASDPFTDIQYLLLASFIREQAARYGFAISRDTVVGHDEIPPGIRDGKSDPGYQFAWAKLMALLTEEEPPIKLPLDTTCVVAALVGLLLVAGAAAVYYWQPTERGRYG